jgi:hypothetical protein
MAGFFLRTIFGLRLSVLAPRSLKLLAALKIPSPEGARMGNTTDWVRRALAELGPDATVREVTDFILRQDPTVPKSYISLTMRNLKKRGLAADKKKPRRQ